MRVFCLATMSIPEMPAVSTMAEIAVEDEGVHAYDDTRKVTAGRRRRTHQRLANHLLIRTFELVPSVCCLIGVLHWRHGCHHQARRAGAQATNMQVSRAVAFFGASAAGLAHSASATDAIGGSSGAAGALLGDAAGHRAERAGHSFKTGRAVANAAT